ncbi:MAG: hypothetical protein IJ087_23040 [Eggerthellaceae bacterium]|nr:hypothetical protein [Eggerthellaceae bacterium]
MYRSTKKSGGFKRVAAVKSPSYVDKNLRLQQTYYYYKVRAVNGKFKGAFSSVRSIVAWLAPP